MKTTITTLLCIAAASLVPYGAVAQQTGAAPGTQAEQRVRVQSFRFTGNAAIPSASLAPIVASYEGKDLTLADLRAAAQKVAEYYQEHGYFLARVVVPEQDASGGTVTLQVVEGKLGKVTFAGNLRTRPELLHAYLAGVGRDGAIRQDTLERGLLLLNDLPGLKATSVLQAGQDPGTTDVLVNVKESRLSSGAVEVNNFGSRYSRLRMSVSGNFGTPRGDSFGLRVVSSSTPNSLLFGDASYSGPIGTNGTRIGLYVLNGDFGIGREFSALNIEGRATALGLSLTHPFVKTRRVTTTGIFSLDARDSKQRLLGTTSSYDRIRVAQVGVSRTVEGARGRSLTSLMLQQGLGSFLGGMKDGDPRSSRFVAGADGSFTKVTVDAARLHILSPRWFLLGRFSGQFSTRSLVVGEQMAIGGPDSVRGYPQSEFLGDHGAQASLEARYALTAAHPEKVQGVLFADAGLVNVKNPAVGQTKSPTLSGVGFGFRVNPSRGLTIRADVGFPLGRRPSSGGTVAPYLQVGSKF